jgi:hypothetical protein
MSTQEAPREKTNLALFLSESLGIGNRQQLQEFLEQPGVRTVVRSAPYQDVFLAVKTVGLADSLELLQLTTKEQRRGFIDLDCWRKDSFHVGSFMEWIAAFVECGPEEAVAMCRSVDPNLLALFFKENIEIFALELDDPPPDRSLILTPDNRFGVEIASEGEGATLSRLLLDAMFRFDPSLGYDLIDRVRWENQVSMEEEAYQDKRRRLEEIGFVDYYEALEIYSEQEIVPRQESTVETKDEASEASTTLPALFVASLPPGHYLLEALQRISDKAEAERIRQGLAALANRVLSVHTVTPGDLDKVQPALQEIRDTLSLALEHLAEGQPVSAVEILRKNSVQVLFKTGFNLIAAVRDEAEQISSDTGLRLEGCRETLLESPNEEFFSGLRRLQPLFFQGLDEPPKPIYRNFQRLKDIQIGRERLREIGLLARGFWRLFPNVAVRAALSSLSHCNLSKDEIRFSQVFNTACLNLSGSGRFTAEPLDLSGLRETLMRASMGDSSEDALFSMLNALALKWISQRLEDVHEKKVLSKYADEWLRATSAELAPLISERPIQARLIRSVLVRVRTVNHTETS